MKRTNSALSRLSSAYVRSGVALEGHFHAASLRGRTCASRSAARYDLSSRFAWLGFVTSAFPPWQSVQPSTTPGFWCIVWRSVSVWQLMQPRDFASASITPCRSGAGSEAKAGNAEIAETAEKSQDENGRRMTVTISADG